MATTLARPTPMTARQDPGTALLELLGFADTIRASQPPRPPEPLAFPPLAQIAKRRRAVATPAER
jgi:hypothetical protein